MRPLRRPWHKWEVNMELDLYVDLIHLAEDTDQWQALAIR